MVKNVVFDFGKVLVNYDFPMFVASIFKDDIDGCKAFLEMICNEKNVARYDKGDQSFEEIIADWKVEYPYWKDQLEEFCVRHIDVVLGEIPGMRDLITRLKAAGYGVYGLTNWSNVVYQVIRKFDILRMMDGTVISSEEKLIKPDPAIYKVLFERFNLKPEECVFVDDKLANVEGARKVGMPAIQFLNAKQLESELGLYIKL